jgi:hypothetical protein
MNWKRILMQAASGDPVEMKRSDFDEDALQGLPEDVTLLLMGPAEFWISRDGGEVVVQVSDTERQSIWDDKYNLSLFAEAMTRAVRRLAAEGRPYEEPEVEPSHPDYFFIRWTIRFDAKLPGRRIIDAAHRAFEEVWNRAERMLEDSDSVLVLGKDTRGHLKRLHAIAAVLTDLGYHVYLVEEQPNRPGETVLQKVLRYALSSKFIIVENTDPSGHLYEFPHVAKMAECVVAVLQEKGKGATWMFEDGYARHRHWKKFGYSPEKLKEAVHAAAEWGEDFVKRFTKKQKRVLPWL